MILSCDDISQKYFPTKNLAITNRSCISCAHEVVTVSWSPPSKLSLKVIENVTVWYSAYDFLLPFHCNYGPILYHFPHIARYWSKTWNLYTPCIQCPRWYPPFYTSPWLPVLSNVEPPALWTKAATDKLVEKIVKHESWPIQPDILNPPLLRLTSRKLLWMDLQPVDIKSRWRHNWKSAQVVNSHLVATGFRPPSATAVSAQPFSHGTGTLRCLQKEMATYRHWSVSLWWDTDDVSHCRILSPDKTEWRLISATLCKWRRCFVADHLWFMTRIWEEEEDGGDPIRISRRQLVLVLTTICWRKYDMLSRFDTILERDGHNSYINVTRQHCCADAR